MPKVPERELTITDSFMFGRVMRDEGICRGLLERVLGFPIERIVYQSTEQVLDPLPDAKGVQLDLYLKDDARVYDVEMQVEKDADLPRRFRHYQSVIDADDLPKGSVHARLRESYVIFLCAHDPLDDGLPVHTIERVCLESGAVIDTGAHWLALNCRAWERVRDEGLRNLLQYVENGRVAEGDALLGAIDEAVARANADRKWVSKVRGVMTMYDDALGRGLMRGRAEGRAEGLTEGEEIGLLKGRVEGRAEGEARLSTLIDELLSSDRIDDAKRAATDAAYRDALFRELGIA